MKEFCNEIYMFLKFKKHLVFRAFPGLLKLAMVSQWASLQQKSLLGLLQFYYWAPFQRLGNTIAILSFPVLLAIVLPPLWTNGSRRAPKNITCPKGFRLVVLLYSKTSQTFTKLANRSNNSITKMHFVYDFHWI